MILLGQYNAQGLGSDYELLLRCTKGNILIAASSGYSMVIVHYIYAVHPNPRLSEPTNMVVNIITCL